MELRGQLVQQHLIHFRELLGLQNYLYLLLLRLELHVYQQVLMELHGQRAQFLQQIIGLELHGPQNYYCLSQLHHREREIA